MVDKSVDGRDGHGFVRKDLIPSTEGLIGRNGDAAIFVSPGNQFEEYPGFGLILVGIGDVIKDDQVKFVELGQSSLEYQISTCGLQSLDEIAGPSIEDPMACFDQGMTDGTENVGLARAGVANGDQVCAAVQPVSGSQGFDPGAR
jgi:hypothetical protein